MKELRICLQKIEDKLGWGPSAAWSTQDFMSLSDKIFEVSGIQLSQTTLKRVWGKVKYESNPTPTTLNALAMFLGYENWRSFVKNNEFSQEQSSILVDAKARSFPVKPLVLGGAVIMLVVFASLLGLTSSDKSPRIIG